MINYNTPVRVIVNGVDLDPKTGLPMYRQHHPFTPDPDRGEIVVQYDEWLDLNGQRLQQVQKYYIVKNIPAITHIDENGNEVEDVPAANRFDAWNEKLITEAMVGTTFGQLMSGAINYTLVRLPFDVPNGFAVRPS